MSDWPAPRDDGPPLSDEIELAHVVAPIGSNSGIQTSSSSWGSKSTWRGMPNSIASMSQLTRLVVRRRSSCSTATNDGEDERWLEPGHPGLVVHRVREQLGAPGHGLDPDVLRVALRAEHGGWMEEVPARAAPLEPELAVAPSLPEVLVPVRDPRQDPERDVSHHRHPPSRCRASRCRVIEVAHAASNPRRACGIASTAGRSPKPGLVSMIEPRTSSHDAPTSRASREWRTIPGPLRRITTHARRTSSWVFRSGAGSESIWLIHEFCASWRAGNTSWSGPSNGKLQSSRFTSP